MLVAGTTTVAAVPQQPQRPPVFRTNTELIEIDVVVVDKAGQRVHGLTKDDFILRDRKKPQAIETFAEVQRAIEREKELPPLPPETRVDVAVNTGPKSGRLVVMVLDDLHVWRGRTDTVRDIAREIVAKLGPESSMALIQTGGEHGVEATDDRSRLLASIEKFKGRMTTRRPMEACDPIGRPGDGENGGIPSGGCDLQELNANRSLLRSLEDAARILGRGDKRRKAFMLVSEHVAKDISGIFGGGQEIPDVKNWSDWKAAPAFDYQLLNTMNAMRRGNVATYSIDPRGAVSTQKLQDECFPPPSIPDPCVGTMGPGELIDWTAWVRRAQHGLEIISEETGGFAVVNTDDFTGGISEIINDLDNYYLLGFYTEDMKSKGYRQVDVEVKGRPDLELRYRQGYQIDDAPPPPKETDELSRLIRSALPTSDLPLRLHAIPMPAPDTGPAVDRVPKVAVALELTVPTQSMKTADTDRLLDDIRYGLYAIDLKGAKVRERTGSGAKVALRPRPGLAVMPDKVTYEIVSELQLAPGQYQLRASAVSEKLAASGSVYLSFEVPDFSKADLLLTDLVIAYADGPHVPIAREVPRTFRRPLGATSGVVTAAQLQGPPPLLPFEPTLDRVFTSRDTLRLYFKAVQRTPNALTATISALSPDGIVLLTFDRALAPDRQSSLDVQLPLAQLTPGAYRLRVVVSDGAMSDSREIGLVVIK